MVSGWWANSYPRTGPKLSTPQEHQHCFACEAKLGDTAVLGAQSLSMIRRHTESMLVCCRQSVTPVLIECWSVAIALDARGGSRQSVATRNLRCRTWQDKKHKAAAVEPTVYCMSSNGACTPLECSIINHDVQRRISLHHTAQCLGPKQVNTRWQKSTKIV